MIAIAGPFAGGLGAAAVWVAGDIMDSNLLRALAYTGFLLNLFNLLPVGILDGGQLLRSYRYLESAAPRWAGIPPGRHVRPACARAPRLGMFGAHVVQSRL